MITRVLLSSPISRLLSELASRIGLGISKAFVCFLPNGFDPIDLLDFECFDLNCKCTAMSLFALERADLREGCFGLHLEGFEDLVRGGSSFCPGESGLRCSSAVISIC